MSNNPNKISSDKNRMIYKRLVRPIFILGCGRSGTTIFGTALGNHKKITFLNEPRHIWSQAYPETDIWVSRDGSSGRGKLELTAKDVDPEKNKTLNRLFLLEIIKSGSPILIEKLPINNFRLNFIHHIFPDARFIHIYRNGLEVARSIEKLCKNEKWFARNPDKWNRLVKYEQNKFGNNKISKCCYSNFEKGLFEWRLSTESAVSFLRELPLDKYFEFKYDNFVDDSSGLMSKVLEFIEIENTPEVNHFLSDNIKRITSKMEKRVFSEKERFIGGKLLPLSIDSEKGLVHIQS